MADLQTDGPELRGTYFAVRVGLIASAVLVMLAPVAQRLFGVRHAWPQSISDSYYSTSVLIFVIGLATASTLLLVVRADQFIEHTLLKVAGMFGLVVSAVACQPKDRAGNTLDYADALATQNRFTLGALLVVGTVTWLLSLTGWFPIDVGPRGARGVRRRWNVDRTATWLAFFLLVPLLLALGWLLIFWNDGHWLTRESHLPAAFGLFIALALVAFARTRRGLELMERLGDHPVDDDCLNRRVLAHRAHRAKAFDLIYGTIAWLIALVLVWILVRVLQGDGAPKGWLLKPEYALLLLFGAFWCTQTAEAARDAGVTGRR